MYQGRFQSGVQRSHPQNAGSGQKAAPQPQRAAAQPQRTAPQSQRTAPHPQRTVSQPPKKKRGPRVGGMIFYTLYFLMIGVFAVGMVFTLNWLEDWLVDFEAAQPTTKSQQVFEQLFSTPDWGQLYDLSGAQDTPYEGKDQYVSYMTEKVGSAPLTFTPTSNGTSADKKFLVQMDGKTVASFTLSGETEHVTDIPSWDLGEVDLVFDRAAGYRIQKLEGHTAYVNGAPLDDSFTIQIATTKAEEYLPIGTAGVRTCIQEISGLMVKPTVTINDQDGNPVEVVYDESSGMFVEKSVGGEIPDDLRERATGAAESYGKLMIRECTARELAKYYDTAGDAYKEIMGLYNVEGGWLDKGTGYKIMNETVSEYTRYSDVLFSARVSLSMDSTRKDGSIKSYPIDTTFFFTLKNDKWMVYQMTNEEVQLPVGQVRLTFMNGETELNTGFYDTDSKELLTPVVSAPEGKVFAGWFRETLDENGRVTLNRVFVPDETGLVTIPSGVTLEPMTLHAYFEDAEGGET